MSVTPVVSPLVDTYWMLAEFSAGTVFSHPEVTTCRIVNPVVWATGVVPSAPRVTVHVVPLTLVTAMISLPAPAAVSTTWNWVGGIAVEDAAGNDVEDATVQFSTVPPDGASVPPEETVVVARSVKISAVTASPLSSWCDRQQAGLEDRHLR